jgi:hypothetical protein
MESGTFWKEKKRAQGYLREQRCTAFFAFRKPQHHKVTLVVQYSTGETSKRSEDFLSGEGHHGCRGRAGYRNLRGAGCTGFAVGVATPARETADQGAVWRAVIQ